ncbi:Zinc knuckle domain containing protein [Penicillium argentinense]|uniref:Zinc knuckle domain containing protein n=1 Tax=Penicillium argentinense TaxID=1131581 RepID=A0A9W9G692_9EURO|nr:Zinc knuckle domain containing protein [Penicillium argentinense]KAJ5112806.1 Zinc knuckle domain containing protein [Penicillium argentinense]
MGDSTNISVNDGSSHAQHVVQADVPSPFEGYREPPRPESEASANQTQRNDVPNTSERQSRPLPPFPSSAYQEMPPPGWMWIPSDMFQLMMNRQGNVLMPDPGTPGAPLFNKKDARKFLRNFEKLCQRRGISDPARQCELFADYCEDSIQSWVEYDPLWKSRDWEAFKDMLLANEVIQEIQRCEWLITGLPDWLRHRVAKRGIIDFDRPSRPMRLDWIADEVSCTMAAQDKYERVIKTTGRPSNQEVTSTKERKSVAWKGGFSAEKPAISSGRREKNLEEQVEEMRRQYNDMKLTVNMLQSGMAKKDMRNDTAYVPADASRLAYRGQRLRPADGRSLPICYFCGIVGHISKPTACQAMSDAISKGDMHVGNDGKSYIGRAGEGGPTMQFISGRPSMEGLPAQLREWRRNTLRVPAQHLMPMSQPTTDPTPLPRQIPHYDGQSIYNDLGISPEENQEIDCDDEIIDVGYESAGINAVETRGSQQQDPVRAKRRANGIASTKTWQSGQYMQPSRQARVENIDNDDVMMDRPPDSHIEPRTQYIPVPATSGRSNVTVNQRKSVPVSQVKKTAPYMTSTAALEALVKRRVLDTKVDLTVEEMGRIIPRLKTNLFRDTEGLRPAIPQPTSQSENVTNVTNATQLTPSRYGGDDHLQVAVGNVHPSTYRDDRRSTVVEDRVETHRDVYSLGRLYSEVIVAGYMLRGMIDSGSGVDVMGRKQAETLGLPIKQDPKIHVVPVNGVHVKCLGCIQNMPIPLATSPLTPFMEATMMALAQQPDGKVECTVYNDARTRKVVFPVYSPEENKIIRASRLWPNEMICENAPFVEGAFKLLSRRMNSGTTPAITNFPRIVNFEDLTSSADSVDGFDCSDLGVLTDVGARPDVGVPAPLSGYAPMNLLNVSAGSVIDLDDYYLPPEWKDVDVDGFRDVGFGDVRSVHYRSTTKDVDSLPPCRDHGVGFIHTA